MNHRYIYLLRLFLPALLAAAGGGLGFAPPPLGRADEPVVPAWDAPPPAPDETLVFEAHYTVTLAEGTERARLTVLLPVSLQRRQVVSDLRFSQKPLRRWQVGENDYATFEFPAGRSPVLLVIAGRAEIYRYDLLTAMNRPPAAPEPIDRRVFLQAERLLEVDAPEIQELAADLGAHRPVDLVKQIHGLVTRKVRYTFSEETRGAQWAAQNGRGDCDELTALFVALCRARGLPARWVFGQTTSWVNTPKHSWAEVYFDEYGWVPFDPTFNLAPQRNPAHLQPIYFYLSRLRNDPDLKYSMLYYFEYWGQTPAVEYTLLLNRSDAAAPIAAGQAVNWDRSLMDPNTPLTDASRLAFLRQALREDPLDIQTARQITRLQERYHQQSRRHLDALARGLRACQQQRYLAAARLLRQATVDPQVMTLSRVFLASPLEALLDRCDQQNARAICTACGGTRQADCELCGGSGRQRCPECKGRGQIRIAGLPALPAPLRRNIPMQTCPTCRGWGTIPCPACGQRGTVPCIHCPAESGEPTALAAGLDAQIEDLIRAVHYLLAGGLDLYTDLDADRSGPAGG
ncbi:MAG: hypothetical protein JW810_07505 [Sedimentisphaerales bacterium]|nr:hypothetical protein [Sedimentisphaerales bacterium]